MTDKSEAIIPIIFMITLIIIGIICYAHGIETGKEEIKEKLINGECIEHKTLETKDIIYLFCDRYEINDLH